MPKNKKPKVKKADSLASVMKPPQFGKNKNITKPEEKEEIKGETVTSTNPPTQNITQHKG